MGELGIQQPHGSNVLPFVLIVISFSVSVAINCFVERNPDLIFLPWPFQVSSDSEKYLAESSADNPGHEE